jgi:putative ABC transport system ATP-binding protein
MMGIFQELNSNGISILLVTHEPDIAQYCMRNVIFRDGLIKNEVMVTDRKNAKEELEKLGPVKIAENELV